MYFFNSMFKIEIRNEYEWEMSDIHVNSKKRENLYCCAVSADNA